MGKQAFTKTYNPYLEESALIRPRNWAGIENSQDDYRRTKTGTPFFPTGGARLFSGH
jgi:hypothetical protein